MIENTLKNLAAELARCKEENQAIRAKIHETDRERVSLESEVTKAETEAMNAERRHADALASVMLMECTEAEASSAEKAVADARKAVAALSGNQLRIKSLASISEVLSRRYVESEARTNEIAERYRLALIAELDARAEAAMNEANGLLAGLSASSAKLAGLKGMLSELGRSWNHGIVTVTQSTLNPAPIAVQLFQNGLRLELAGISGDDAAK